MTAKELAEILMKNPDVEVTIQRTESLLDSWGDPVGITYITDSVVGINKDGSLITEFLHSEDSYWEEEDPEEPEYENYDWEPTEEQLAEQQRQADYEREEAERDEAEKKAFDIALDELNNNLYLFLK